MARTDSDTWDLASSVGATATMVAAARAAASRRPRPVINDYFAEASGTGLRQVVIVASGLDSRPYRLSWPAGTTVYELDQPEVIEFKTSTLSKIGAVPATEHRPVGIDLRGDWPAALQRAGFDATQPTAWLAEGVLIGFLPPEAEVRLLDNVIALSATGSRLAADFGSLSGTSQEAQEQARIMAEGWRRQGLELDIASLTYPGEHTDVAAHLQAEGWETVSSGLADLFVAAGLPELQAAEQQGSAAPISFVRAIRV